MPNIFYKDGELFDVSYRYGIVPFPPPINIMDDEKYFEDGKIFSVDLSDQSSKDVALVTAAMLGYHSRHISVSAIGTKWSPPPVNSITDPLNPFDPVAVIDGVVIAGTPPVGAVNLIDYDLKALTGGTVCRANSYNISLNLGGGTFEVVTLDNPGYVKGDVFPMAGLKGLVTGTGKGYSNSGAPFYVTRGIFGSRNMNKQLLLTVNSTSAIAGLLPNIYLRAPALPVWSTCATAARAIASDSGVPLQWAVPDVPLYEAFGETGTTVFSSLQSLASRCNAALLWDGNEGYVVADLVTGWGGATIRGDCSEIGVGGLANFDNLDLESGISLIPIPASLQQDGYVTFNEHPLHAPLPPKIEQLFTMTFKPGDGQIIYVSLPGDFQRPAGFNPAIPATFSTGKVQIIPARQPNPFASVAAFVPQIVRDPIQGTVGYDQSQWFDAGLPIVQDPHTGIYKAVLSSSSPLFPSESGDFTLNAGYVRDNSVLLDAQIQIINAKKAQLAYRQAAEASKMRIFETMSATINLEFQGYVPCMPGQLVSFTFNGDVFQGTCKSVQISNRQVNVSLGKFVHVNRMSAIGMLDASLVGSQPRP